MSVSRWLPLSGVVFVVLVLVSVVGLGGDTPESNASGAEVLRFYDDEQIRQAIAAFIFAASTPFLIFFAVSVGSFRGSSARGAWEIVVVGGSVMTSTIIAVLAAIVFAKTDGATNDASPEALQALNLLDADSWVAFNAGFGVMMLGAAGCLLTRDAYRWFGWIAIVLGIALFIPFADFIALILTLIWILVMSILVFRNNQAPTTPAIQQGV